MKGLDEEGAAWAENLALRRDMVALVKYLRGNKVTGTSARGNFPLKAVREITAQFVHPPQLDETIGNYTFRLRSEEEVWELYLLHVLGVASGLIEGGQSKKWRVTQLGDIFLTAPAPVQAWVLFSTWWMEINWLVAFPYGAEDQYLPDGYKDHCRAALLSLEAGDRVEIQSFADQLIQSARLTWPAADSEHVQQIRRRYVERTLIYPLVDFELILPETQKEGQDYPIRSFRAFQLKPVGKTLVETVGKLNNS